MSSPTIVYSLAYSDESAGYVVRLGTGRYVVVEHEGLRVYVADKRGVEVNAEPAANLASLEAAVVAAAQLEGVHGYRDIGSAADHVVRTRELFAGKPTEVRR